MTVAEQSDRSECPSFFDRLAQSEPIEAPPVAPDLRGYVEIALRGGFPEAIALSDAARCRWIESYIEQLLTRDALRIESGRDPVLLRRYWEAYALNSAGLADEKTLYETAGINRRTAIAYEQLILNLMVAERIQPWTSNRLKRLIRSPRRYLIDSSLLGGTMRLDANAVLRDGDLLGRLLDTFVMAQLRSDAVTATSRPRLHHLRTEGGEHEIDLIAELGGGRIIGVEIKADAAPGRESARHLTWLLERLGDRFVAGVVLHTGSRVYELGPQISAAPIAAIWGATRDRLLPKDVSG